MLKNALTYEIMKPEDVGVRQTNLVLGKHSGRHALANRMAEIGYNLTEAELDVLFVKFKDLADKKKHISDWDLEALVSSDIRQLNPYYQLDGLQISCGTIGMPTASVRLICPDGETRTVAEIGTGPIDAAYKAIDAIVQVENTLKEFMIHAVTEGIDAVGEVTVRIENAVPVAEVHPQSDGAKTLLITDRKRHV